MGRASQEWGSVYSEVSHRREKMIAAAHSPAETQFGTNTITQYSLTKAAT